MCEGGWLCVDGFARMWGCCGSGRGARVLLRERSADGAFFNSTYRSVDASKKGIYDR